MFKVLNITWGISALYGANAFNGICLWTAPFTSQGITAYAKFGQTSRAAGSNDYVDYGIRMVHAFSPKLAAKATFPTWEDRGMRRIMTKLT
jgi:hypothetical protein